MSRFPCVWCGEDFPTRDDLGAHWLASPECSKNRNVSNAFQPGTMAFGERPVMPGEHTLRLVKANERRETP